MEDLDEIASYSDLRPFSGPIDYLEKLPYNYSQRTTRQKLMIIGNTGLAAGYLALTTFLAGAVFAVSLYKLTELIKP